MDYVEQFGALTLDHRFKRVMHRLIAEATAVYRAYDLDFKPRWQSTLCLLEERGPLSVTEIATEVRLSHPAIIQITNGLLGAGLIRSAKDSRDGRRRVFHVSARGRRALPELRRVWDAIARAQGEAFEAAGFSDVLERLGRLDQELDRTSIVERVLDLHPANPTDSRQPTKSE